MSTRTQRSLLLPGGLLLGCLLLLLTACNDKSRRLSEGETLQYKRQLISSHPGEISPAQQQELMFRAERTEGEIDAVFEEYRARFAERQEADRARFEIERAPSVPRDEAELNSP